MTFIVLVRHGQSEWNLQNRFTGWVDVGLTNTGVNEAIQSGELIAKEGIIFDRAFTSLQRRAIKTLWLSLEAANQFHLPVIKDWRLNERHYGALTGCNKQETRSKYGDDQVHIWRRSFDIPPPKIDKQNQYHPIHDSKYSNVDPEVLPSGESLKMTCDRVLPYFSSSIAPFINDKKNLIISAHGNSLRAILKDLFKVKDKEIPNYEFPTGNPLLIEFGADINTTVSARYLDAERAKVLPEI